MYYQYYNININMCLFCKFTFRSLILVATTSGSAYAFYFHVGKTLKTIKSPSLDCGEDVRASKA